MSQLERAGIHIHMCITPVQRALDQSIGIYPGWVYGAQQDIAHSSIID